MPDAVEDVFDVCELLVRTFVGEVAVDDDKVEQGAVYFVDGNTQGRIAWIAGSDVDVAQDGNALTLCAETQGYS